MASSSLILWQGASLLDGSPIAVVLTGLGGSSSNVKTGRIPQAWIIRSDLAAHTAVKTGADAAVCGDCKHRPFLGGQCYVARVAWRAPRSIYAALSRGSYAPVDWAALSSTLQSVSAVRIGAYGDPAAVPVEVWASLRAAMPEGARMLGYTHQWRSAPVELSRFAMASVDTEAEYLAAQSFDVWRTFRVRAAGETLLPGEAQCPAAKEAGKRRTCETCRACDGSARGSQRASMTIAAH